MDVDIYSICVEHLRRYGEDDHSLYAPVVLRCWSNSSFTSCSSDLILRWESSHKIR